MLRECARREASHTAAILDNQSVKTTESGGVRGHSAAEKVRRRKRHLAVNAQGLLPGVLVPTAPIRDTDSAGERSQRTKPLYSCLRAVFAKSISLIAVRHVTDTKKSLFVLPPRWVFKRSVSWLG
jgi:putative transposase